MTHHPQGPFVTFGFASDGSVTSCRLADHWADQVRPEDFALQAMIALETQKAQSLTQPPTPPSPVAPNPIPEQAAREMWDSALSLLSQLTALADQAAVPPPADQPPLSLSDARARFRVTALNGVAVTAESTPTWLRSADTADVEEALLDVAAQVVATRGPVHERLSRLSAEHAALTQALSDYQGVTR